jgi:hypothetical protein
MRLGAGRSPEEETTRVVTPFVSRKVLTNTDQKPPPLLPNPPTL